MNGDIHALLIAIVGSSLLSLLLHVFLESIDTTQFSVE